MSSQEEKHQDDQKPFKRIVYFINGQTEYGFRYYWPILKRSAATHSKIYNRKIGVEISGEWNGSEEVTLSSSELGARDVETKYRFLKWNDIFQDRLNENSFIALLRGIYLLYRMVFFGDLLNLYRQYWGFGNGILILATLPTITLCCITAVGLYLFNSFLPDIPEILQWIFSISFSFLVLLSTLIFNDFFQVGRSAQYLRLRMEYAKGTALDLEARIQEFKGNIKDAYLNDDCDEVLIVGHSYGMLIAVDCLARVFSEVGAQKPKANSFGLVTLGSVHHFLACLPSAKNYREALKTVGGDDRLYWLEPFCPQDGMNFPKKNPVRDFTDIEPVSGPHQKSLKYRELVSPETYKNNHRKFWKMHFQYLREGDFQGDYSYYRIICSDQFLKDNYGLREKPVKGYMNESLKA